MAKWIIYFVTAFVLSIGISCLCSKSLNEFKPEHIKTMPFVLCKGGDQIFNWRVNERKEDIRDSNGRKINIRFIEDGSLQLSSNADAEFKQLAFNMVKTTVGLKILKLMSTSSIKIEIEFNKDDIPLTTDGQYIGAQTTPIVSTKVDQNGSQQGLPFISSATIVIYEAGIKDMLSKNEGKVLIDGRIINLRLFSTPDIIASFVVHEGTHILYRDFSGALNPKATKYQIERKPYENQLQHYRELLKKQK